MFYREDALAYPNHSLQTCGSPSNTILRNVVENQPRKAETPHQENPNWAPNINPLPLRKATSVVENFGFHVY